MVLCQFRSVFFFTFEFECVHLGLVTRDVNGKSGSDARHFEISGSWKNRMDLSFYISALFKFQLSFIFLSFNTSQEI